MGWRARRRSLPRRFGPLTPSPSRSRQCGAKKARGAVSCGAAPATSVGPGLGGGEGGWLGWGEGTAVGGALGFAAAAARAEGAAEGASAASPMPSPNTLNTDPSLFTTC
jgi:hypothetical protein